MKDWVQTVGSNDYRFRTAKVIDRAISQNFDFTFANIRWDENGALETRCRFPICLDVQAGDRMLIVEHTSGYGLSKNARVLTSTARANSYVADTNLPVLPGLSMEAIKSEISLIFVMMLIIGTAAAVSLHYLGQLAAILIAVIGLLWYAWQKEKWLKGRKVHKRALADENALFADAGKILGKWAREVRAADEIDEIKDEQARLEQERERIRRAKQAEEPQPTQTAKQPPYWEVLKLPSDATWEECRTAYRSKILALHPDRHRQLDPELLERAEELTTRLNRAMEEAKRAFGKT